MGKNLPNDEVRNAIMDISISYRLLCLLFDLNAL